MTVTRINGYVLTTEFTTNNAGMCQWAFCEKNGKKYFIKRLFSPKYPVADTAKGLDEELVKAMKTEADDFYSQQRHYYDKLKNSRNGNVVVIDDFFHEGAFFYIVTEKIEGPFITNKQISTLSEDAKRVLLKSVSYSLSQISAQGIVHGDLKPENVLTKQTAAGYATAKVIDFQSGFFEGEEPDEIVGDQRYFSPEAIQYNCEEDVRVTCKADVFALGVLFHQYWCGEFPDFDKEKYSGPAVALLEHSYVRLNSSIPKDIRDLISQMLNVDPDKRPSSTDVWKMLSGIEILPETEPTGFGLRLPREDDL